MTCIVDPVTNEKLAAYAIGNGSLAVLWRNPDNSPSGRQVTLSEVSTLCKAINEKERREYRWYVSQCLCLLQAELSHN
jgi:hypothetical protein